MTLSLNPKQEAAFNAAGEALVEMGFDCSLGFTAHFFGEGAFFSLTARVPGLDVYASGSSSTLAGAAQAFIVKANDLIANPPPKVLATAIATKDAVSAVLDEYRHKSKGDRTILDPILDEIADRVAALPVKP